MIRHMISSHSLADHVLPYDRLFTRLFLFHGLDLTDQTDQQAPRHYDTFTASTLGRMRIPAPEASPATQPKENEIRGMEAGVDPPNQIEDDLHIPPLQTEYPPTYGEPHFLLLIHQSHHQCPHTLHRHILSSLDTIHRSPILIIHHLLSNLLYMSFGPSFMLCAWTS